MRTYYTILTCFLLLIGKLVAAQGHNLYFSKYVEGSGYDKALEIYNPKSYPVDLKYYKIEVDTDGRGFGSDQRVSSYQLKGFLAPHTSYLMVREVSTNEELKFLADTTLRSNILNFNGNEQIRLREFDGRDQNDPFETVDQIGYPGSTNNMKDMTLVRKSQYAPNMGRVGSAVTDEWIKKAFNDLTCLKLAPGSTNLGGTIDKSKSVGTIESNASVNLSGAAVYKIPIPVLPGINGMQPSISINYNSQGGNGLLGKRWSLGGVSAITRVPRTIYHDNDNKAVVRSLPDRFALDGNRIVGYRTEVNNFSRIVPKGTSLNKYYIVSTKEGRTLEYGLTSDAKVKIKTWRDREDILLWYLNKVTDNNGNTITYSYAQNNGASWLEKIEYANITIQFIYTNDRIPLVSYVGGRKITQEKILSQIQIKSDNNTLYAYKFKYNKNVGFNFDELTSITKINAVGQALNSTKITWGTDISNVPVANAVSVSPSLLQSSFKNQAFTSVDVDGDGLTDLLGSFEKDGKQWWQLYNNTSIVGGATQFKQGVTKSVSKNNIEADRIRFNCGILTGDFKGNGETSIVLPVWKAQANSGNRSLEFISFDDSYPTFKCGNLYENVMPLFITSDLNHDGRDEIIYLNKNNLWGKYITGGILELKADNSGFKETEIRISSAIDNLTALLFNDYNNDGLKDLLIVSETDSRVIFGNSNGLEGEPVGLSELRVKESQWIRTGDFNGDGTPDILILDNAGNKPIKIGYGKGELGINQGHSVLFDYKIFSGILSINDDRTKKDNDKDNCIVTDFNNDGRSDFILFNGTYTHKWDLGGSYYRFRNFVVSYYQSTGSGFELVRTKTIGGDEYSKSKYFTIGDFNGDSRNDILSYGYDWLNGVTTNVMWRLYSSRNNDFSETLVTSITNGFNAKTNFKYRPLTDKKIYSKSFSTLKGSQYTQDFWLLKGVINVQQPLYVTTVLEKPNGLGGFESEIFKYENALIHNLGKGFLGFQKISIENLTTNLTETRYYELNERFFHSTLKKTEVHLNNNLIASTENFNTTKNDNSNVFFPYTWKSVNKDDVKGTTTTTEYEYDDYGNIIKQTTKYGSDATVIVDNVPVTKGAWCPSKISSSTVTKTYTGEDPFITVTNFNYLSNGNLEYQLTNGVKNSFTYDNYGNVDKATSSVYGKPDRVIDYDYDPTHRFISKKADFINQVVSFKYNSWGHVTNSIDVSGNETINLYNAWGQLDETKQPRGHLSNFEIKWAEDNNLGALYYTYETHEDSPYVKTYYDALGRELSVETEGFNGKVYSGIQYNRKGQIYKSITPHYKSGNAKLTTTAYDNLGRSSLVSINGVETNLTYSKLGSSVSSPAGTSSKTYNQLGDVKTATDVGGTISYTYYSCGSPKSMTSNGSTISMTYYPNGQQKTISDPNAGTTKYYYNAWGDLERQDDSKLNSTRILYDKAGRIEHQTCSGLTSDYKYYTSGKNIGLLESVTSTNNTSTHYTYNNYRQVVTEIEKIDGKSFQTSYSYDEYGRVNSIAYPSGFTVTQHYNTDGYLTEVKRADNGKSIWKAGNIEASGQVKSFLLGNGQWTNKSFDNDGYLTAINTGNGQNQNLTYRFDREKGNLLERRDIRNGIIERFTYDSFNRLRSASLNGETQRFDYNDKGNITYKSLVGKYDYKLKRPHAVIGVENEANMIRSEQTITYTAFNKVNQIDQNGNRMNFVYGHDFARRKTELYKNNSKVMTKYFVGNYEQKEMGSSTRKISYIMGGDGLAAIHVGGDGLDQLVYTLKDHLGSIVGLGYLDGVVDERIFDSWGKQRHAEEMEDFAYNDMLSYQDLCRGYTGHEHLHEFGLINMNGRLYDPLLGRFLSPDNYVQMPDYTQNFNRFSYCFNNPLIYTDPSGDYALIDDLIVMGVGGLLNLGVNAIQGNVNSWGEGIGYFATGAAAAEVSIYAGPVAGAMVLGGGNDLTNQISANNGLKNINVGQTLMASIISGGTAYYGGIISSKASPYISSWISGLTSSPVVQQALTQSATNAVSGFGVGTSFSLLSGNDIGTAIGDGGQAALFGSGIGMMNGVISGWKYSNDRGINKWTGERNRSYEYKSVGAKGKAVSLKIVKDKYLKKNGIDAHELKMDYLGKKAPIAHFDIYKAPSGQLFILRKGGVGDPIITHEVIQ